MRVARELERQAAARQRAVIRQQRAIQQADALLQRQRAALGAEGKRLYAEQRNAEAIRQSEEVADQIKALRSILSASLSRNPRVDLKALRRSYNFPPFDDSPWRSDARAPRLEQFLPAPLGFGAALLPGAKRRHTERVATARKEHSDATTAYGAREKQLKEDLARAQNAYVAEWEKIRQDTDDFNVALDQTIDGLQTGVSHSVTEYFSLVLEYSQIPEGFPRKFDVGFLSDSKHLVVDLYLPTIDLVPEASSFKYNRQSDKILPVAHPERRRKGLYADLVAQLALHAISDIFRAGYEDLVDCVTLNGRLETIDPATGNEVNIYLVSVRATRDVFTHLNLRQVDPAACLRTLKASVSRKPDELIPVRPILELNMTDPRFIDSADVLSTLDQRPNLMELNPSEFEALITNLFATMGLDTRLTQPSRDGGVDCVAYDPRPIFGGKVVIQAKRYKNTVGVSAVRDLFGTVQNEGASKGILVTTSGYGKAAFDFAAGKPLELLDGSNLLYLLSQHAGIEAKIVAPENWVDSPLHGS
jgi:restriction system protein